MAKCSSPGDSRPRPVSSHWLPGGRQDLPVFRAKAGRNRSTNSLDFMACESGLLFSSSVVTGAVARATSVARDEGGGLGRDRARDSAQMLAEEGRGAAVGEVGARLVVMRPADAREGMVHLRIDMQGNERIAAEAGQYLLLRLGRHELVLSLIHI